MIFLSTTLCRVGTFLLKFHCAARLNSICSTHIYSNYVSKCLDKHYPLYMRIGRVVQSVTVQNIDIWAIPNVLPFMKLIYCDNIFSIFIRFNAFFMAEWVRLYKLCRLNIFLAMVTGILCSAPIAVVSRSVGSVWKKAMETCEPAVKSVATLEVGEVLRRWWWDQAALSFIKPEHCLGSKKNCFAWQGLRIIAIESKQASYLF